MNEKNDVIQIIGSLMKKPSLLSQTDKYNLSISDFSTNFERYLFDCIEGLYYNGANKISVIDIENSLSSNAVALKIFEQNKGHEYLEDAEEFAEVENFDYYYGHLKKINALKDLEKIGVATEDFYCPDLTKPNAIEINKKFERLTVSEIFDEAKRKILKVERKYTSDSISETTNAYEGIEDIISAAYVGADIGLPVQGKLLNMVMGGARKSTFAIRSGASGLGKALPNSTVIPTPLGWKRVDEIQVGDYLFDGLGRPTKVLGVYPQGEKEVYQITFKDGRTARSCNEHLWSFFTSGQRKKSIEQRKFYTKELKEIQKMELQGKGQDYKIFVPMQKAVQYEEKEYFIPPYIFGLILGDGSFRQHSNNKSFQFSSENDILPKKIAEEMNWYLKKSSDYNFTWYFSKKESQGTGNEKINIWVEDVLKDFPELLNKKSCEKFIPKSYLMGSINQRFDLLNGLLDSDGSVSKDGSRVSYCTNSKELADNFIELAQSLGFKTGFHVDNRKGRNPSYGISIYGSPEDKVKLFKLKRKKDKILSWYNSNKRKESNLGNAIVKIENLKYKEEMTCFTVDNDEELFLTENFIPTHNTRGMVADACFLAFPFRFNTSTCLWEQKGSAEKVLFIATEQGADEIQRMILAYLTGINESKFRYGQFTELEENIIKQALVVLKTYQENFLITKMPSPTNELLKSFIREKCILEGITHVFFDYISITPSLIQEFKGLSLRNDELLLILSTTLKDIASELDVFVMSATQVNASADQNKDIRNEASLAGGRSTINKADYGFIMARPTAEELDVLEPVSAKFGVVPNVVTDVFKVRAGEWTQVRIWSYFDLGILRKEDLFMTDSRLNVVDLSNSFVFDYENWESEEYMKILDELNEGMIV